MTMKTSELREQTADELEGRERELSEQLFVLRLHKETGQLQKPSKVREVKRDLARVLTVLGEKKRAQAQGGDR